MMSGSVTGWRMEGENLPHSFERLTLKVLGTDHFMSFRPHVADYDLSECVQARTCPSNTNEALCLLAKDVTFSLFGYMPPLPQGDDRNQKIWLYGSEVDPHIWRYKDGKLQFAPLFSDTHRRKRKVGTNGDK